MKCFFNDFFYWFYIDVVKSWRKKEFFQVNYAIKFQVLLSNFITKSFCGEVTRFCHLSVFVVAINKRKMIKQLDIKQHFLIQKKGKMKKTLILFATK